MEEPLKDFSFFEEPLSMKTFTGYKVMSAGSLPVATSDVSA